MRCKLYTQLRADDYVRTYVQLWHDRHPMQPSVMRQRFQLSPRVEQRIIHADRLLRQPRNGRDLDPERLRVCQVQVEDVVLERAQCSDETLQLGERPSNAMTSSARAHISEEMRTARTRIGCFAPSAPAGSVGWRKATDLCVSSSSFTVGRVGFCIQTLA